jgi:hypothetical protein
VGPCGGREGWRGIGFRKLASTCAVIFPPARARKSPLPGVLDQGGGRGLGPCRAEPTSRPQAARLAPLRHTMRATMPQAARSLVGRAYGCLSIWEHAEAEREPRGPTLGAERRPSGPPRDHFTGRRLCVGRCRPCFFSPLPPKSEAEGRPGHMVRAR